MKQVASILEIRKARKAVKFGELTVEVQALSIADLTDIATRFDPFRALLLQQSFDPKSIFACGREAVGAVIAASQGKLGDAEFERAAGELDLAAQMELMIAAYEATFPGGFGPFVERLAGLGIRFDAAPAETPSSDSSASESSQPPPTIDPSPSDSPTPLPH